MSSGIASTAGVELALHESAAAGKRSLLVAHATGFCGRAYDPLVARLSGFSVVAPDLRGHGDSTTPDDLDFDWEGLADDVGAVVAHLGSRRPLFAFGHSMGGAVSILAEARHPGTFAAIYTFEPIIYPPALAQDGERRSRFVEGTKKRRRDFASKAAARANYREKAPFDVFTTECLDAYLEHGFHHHGDGSITLKMDPVNESRMYSMSLAHPTWDRLAEVRCPVVVAHGRRLRGTPADIAEQVVDRLPDGRLESFDDLGHMGPFEDPDRIARQVQTFFDCR